MEEAAEGGGRGQGRGRRPRRGHFGRGRRRHRNQAPKRDGAGAALGDAVSEEVLAALGAAAENNVATLQRLAASGALASLQRPPQKCSAAVVDWSSPRMQQERLSAFVRAAEAGSLDALRYFLQHLNASVNTCGSMGVSALTAGAARGRLGAVKLLLEHGADYTAGAVSPLHAACTFGHYDVLAYLLSVQNVKIDWCDAEERTPLHVAALSGFVAGVNLLLQHGAVVAHDAKGFSPLYYAFQAYLKSKSRNDRSKATSSVSGASRPDLLQCILALSDKTPFLFDTFRTVTERDARDALVRHLGEEKVITTLAEQQFVLDDNKTFNQIFISVCRVLKVQKKPLDVDLSKLRIVFSLLVSEATISALEILVSLLMQSFCREWLSIGVLDALMDSIIRAARICLFGHQPYVDYATDYMSIIVNAFLRMVVSLAPRLRSGELERIQHRFDAIIDLVDQSLLDVDLNIQESDRFAVLVHCTYLWQQVFPLDDVALREVESDGRSHHMLPKLDWFLHERPVSAAFTDFHRKHHSALRHIGEDVEEVYWKYFEFECRVGGLPGKAKYIQSASARGTRAETSIQLNRFTSGGTAEQNRDAFEFLVQQVMALSPKGFNAHLQAQFVGEPGVGEGPLREMLSAVQAYLFGPDSPFFDTGPSGRSMHIKADSTATESDLRYFETAGRLIALSVNTNFPLGVRLTSALLNRLLGRAVTVDDVQDFDAELHDSLKRLQNRSFDDLALDIRFEYTCGKNGVAQDVPLKANGADIRVTDANKEEYIALLIEQRLWGGVEQQAQAFVRGFTHVLPPRLSLCLSPKELGELLCGPEELNIAWMRTDLVSYLYGFSGDSPVITWFWQYLQRLTPEKQARLLMFWSGSAVPPLEGFSQVDSWTISPLLSPVTSLPRSSTCTFSLQIPRYSSYEMLSERFEVVLESGFIGYDIA